jgi:hypothetical protein
MYYKTTPNTEKPMTDRAVQEVNIYEILDNIQVMFANHSVGDSYSSTMLQLISDIVQDTEPTSEEVEELIGGFLGDILNDADGEPVDLDNATANGNRSYVLRTAETHVNGKRNIDYGDPISDFRTTAEFWQTYLRRVVECRGSLTLKPHDVAAMMMMLKMSRISWSPDEEDHWIDAAGYAACGYDCTERQ